MSTSGTQPIVSLLLVFLLRGCLADVSHFFASSPTDLGSFLHGQAPFQLGLSPSAFYGSPVTPAPAAVAAPVATTEFSLPEIIENRSVKAKAQPNFIPLSQHYLPPAIEQRPSYESPTKPGEESYPAYYYPPPPASPVTTPPQPIVVQDPGEDIETIHSPGYDYHAPSTPAPVYLPPSESLGELRLRLKDMRCLPEGFFRAVLKLDSFLGAAPTVDHDSDDVQDKRCELKLARSFLLLDIAGADFERCGVRSCGQDLCLRLRFPAIRGLRTGGDSILTLHCKSQERVAVKTHALKMGVANDVQSRSVGNYAHGGNQNAFRTHVELLRRGSNGYTRHLETNGAVQLGEELLLRAHVLAGDGWNYTKLSDVQLQRIAAGGEVLNTVQLISSRGCLNPAMQAICSHAPIVEPPLGQRFHFKAVMFPGMRSGDVLVMSMRISGCLEREDCQITAQDCLPSVAQRRRRNADTTAAAGNGTEISEFSQLSFRVIMPGVEEEEVPAMRHVLGASKSLALWGSVAFVALLLAVALVALHKFGR
ncbi:uncharacterized protein LOC117892424 [Drosophila subobscura]|uniref:uncharacterized protein LOC117892424 n=1 Tax=Drosophila subobscura TaxID=7241 RepID=UPI00155ABD87|nr:uncharacterized protein LOC117892424 [Drosophila subobscura]